MRCWTWPDRNLTKRPTRTPYARAFHLGYLPGCIGRVAELHATYHEVASELSEFCLRYVDGRDGLWLASGNGVIHSSIVIDGSPSVRKAGLQSRADAARVSVGSPA